MKECIKDFCDKETKEKCDSFYKEAFLNRNELVRMLKKENKQLKLDNQKLDSCLTEYTSLYREELDKNNRVLKYIKDNSHKTEWGDLEQDNESIDINDDITDTEFIENILNILRGEDSE